MQPLSLLKSLYLLKGLSDGQIEQVIAISQERNEGKGKSIFKQGEKATALFVLQSGSVRIHQQSKVDENIEISILGPGSHCGEMAFIDSENRSATATCLEKTEFLEIPYQPFEEILSKNIDIAVHVYRQLSHFLCGRLRITTNDLSFARSQNISYF